VVVVAVVILISREGWIYLGGGGSGMDRHAKGKGKQKKSNGI
jgi:hypothetical protein